MQNDSGKIVDLYLPRKCSATNRLIASNDHASVQIHIAKVDASGRATGESFQYAFSGKLRAQGEADDSLNRLAQADGVLFKVFDERHNFLGMSLAANLEELFGSRDPYAVLGVSKTASEIEIKRAYRRLALTFHPDKHSGTDDTIRKTQQFQILGRICEILTDGEKRKIFDESGDFGDDDGPSLSKGEHATWDEYFRSLFVRVDEDLLETFSNTYKGSEEEQADLKAAYISQKGNMSDILDSVMCSNVLDDEERFRQQIQKWIDAGEVEEFKAFSKETQASRNARRIKAEKEAKEAQKALTSIRSKASKKEKDPSTDDALAMMIQSRNQARKKGFDSLIANLEAKYANAEQEDDEWEDDEDEEEKPKPSKRKATKK